MPGMTVASGVISMGFDGFNRLPDDSTMDVDDLDDDGDALGVDPGDSDEDDDDDALFVMLRDFVDGGAGGTEREQEKEGEKEGQKRGDLFLIQNEHQLLGEAPDAAGNAKNAGQHVEESDGHFESAGGEAIVEEIPTEGMVEQRKKEEAKTAGGSEWKNVYSREEVWGLVEASRRAIRIISKDPHCSLCTGHYERHSNCWFFRSR